MTKTKKPWSKKKKVGTILALSAVALLIGGSVALSMSFGPDTHTETLADENSLVSGARLSHMTLTPRTLYQTTDSDGNETTTQVVHYDFQPSDLTGLTFSASLAWSTAESEDYESSTWQEDKKVEDYVTYTTDTNSQDITFTCKQAFGRAMTFTLTCTENTDVYAVLTLDYERKMLTKPSATINSDLWVSGQATSVTTTNPTFSVGTKGERTPKPFYYKVNYEMDEDNQFAFYESIPFPNLDGASDTENLYIGSTKYTIKEGRLKLASLAQEYLSDCLLMKKTYNYKDLKSLLTYQRVEYGSKKTSVSVAYDFVKTYNENYDLKNALCLYVFYGQPGTEGAMGIMSGRFHFKIEPAMLESVNLSGNIVF